MKNTCAILYDKPALNFYKCTHYFLNVPLLNKKNKKKLMLKCSITLLNSINESMNRLDGIPLLGSSHLCNWAISFRRCN